MNKNTFYKYFYFHLKSAVCVNVNFENTVVNRYLFWDFSQIPLYFKNYFKKKIKAYLKSFNMFTVVLPGNKITRDYSLNEDINNQKIYKVKKQT